MMKVSLIIVALLMVSGEISTQEISLALSPIEHSSPPQSETETSPSPSPSHSEMSQSPTTSDDYVDPPSSQFPEASDLNHTDITGTPGEKTSGGGGKKTVIAVGAIAAASMVGVGGYVVLKKRRDNIRRSRYGYAATEIF